MSEIQSAWDVMARLNARGFVVHLSIDRDGCQRVWAMAGDCNCPHRKLYDQNDGHGFIMLDSEDWDEWFSSETDFSVLNAMQMLERKIDEAYAKQAPVAEMTRHQPAKLDDGGSSPSGGST